MWQAVWTGGAVVAAGLALATGSAPARAASDVGVGGYHDQAVEAVHRDLLARGPVAAGRYNIRLESGESTAVTAFTPRFGGLGLGSVGRNPDDSVAGAEPTPTAATAVHSMLVGLGGTEIAGWAVDLAATAGMVNRSAPIVPSESGLVVGGQLAVSGVRLDAAYGEDADLLGLGLDGTRMTAGVTYGFGPVDTRVSYSVVEGETTVDTSLFTLGSRLTLQPGLVVQGDVAYADDENGDVATAGRVSLQFNF